MTGGEYRSMRKAAAVRNPILHAVIDHKIRTNDQAACGSEPKTGWVDCGPAEGVTCQLCRRHLVAAQLLCTDIKDENAKLMRWTWERLTIAMLRRGYAELYMRHFLATEFRKLCDDPFMRRRIGVEDLGR